MNILVGRSEIPVKIIQAKEIETCPEQKVVGNFFVIDKTQDRSIDILFFKIFFEFFDSLKILFTVTGKYYTCFLGSREIMNFPLTGYGMGLPVQKEQSNIPPQFL